MMDDFYFSDEKRIPYKWSAPEAISHGRFSVKSDVWSFGILLYEIVTHGQVPYPGMSNHVFMEVEKGYRMPCPDNCPQAVYAIMMSCWEKKADARPEFKQLVWKLDNCTNYEEQNSQEWG
ncbi:Protein-tyrosine kinase 6 [Acipenser ruthenus]|uniref:Protein-tyrosine kinase 6 n=1 Tax=Acipenser ruthenus TaxID=7906 RepID=A0A444UBM1_ACIRT|nr:Protein-tyrosine kinase 6 [Acipenser ruthenus]